MDSEKMKMLLLMRGNVGSKVAKLKFTLQKVLGGNAAAYPGLTDGEEFNADTETALRAWQASVGLVADGIAGPRTLSILGITPPTQLAVSVDIALVAKLFPFTKTSNIEKNLPYVAAALAAFGLTDANMVGAALGTIRAETEGFVPIGELPSHFNTLPGQAAFSAYEHKLGNKKSGDGALYRGRGFVQLTGKDNYHKFGEALDIGLLDNPDCACAPEVAACLLAAYLDANRDKLSKALAENDLAAARKVVNGGSHGLERFSDTFHLAQEAWFAAKKPLVGAAKAAAPVAARRESLDVMRDPTDLRDRQYMPPPRPLPQIFPENDKIKKFIGAYAEAGLILDQGQEGACTGFGLACVVNYQRWIAAGVPEKFESVSPRMLYHFARRFDEYEGENYDGSSCRGALKGWFYNGVCLENKWSYEAGSTTLPKAGWDGDAIEQTLGVYYRIDPQAITDLQAAIQEVGAIYASAYTHHGWDAVKTDVIPTSHATLPVIDYDGKPSRSGGHAFALVGYNRAGFVIQNSWGNKFGAGGFAVISYADWLAHAMDVWITAMGVPGVVSGRFVIGAGEKASVAAAAVAAGHTHWWDEEKAYQHSIVLGNNGRVDRYDTLDSVTRSLQNQACVLPDTWFRQNGQDKKRLVIYAHGGLNSEAAAIQRARVMGRYFLGNGCYPLFLVWKSGLLDSLSNILSEKIGKGPAGMAGGIGDWLKDKLTDKISDPVIEKTIGRPFARPLWSEMKENAELASESERGGDLLVTALRALASSWGDQFELHLIGHSAGSIILGRLLSNLAQKSLTESVKSTHLYAPACTVAFANRYYAPQASIMKNLYLDILDDHREQDDNVAAIYNKSLLYLVSNALEADLRTPILGLDHVYKAQYSGWDGSSNSAEDLTNWRDAVKISGLQNPDPKLNRLIIHNEDKFLIRREGGDHGPAKTENASHGGFDNNIDIIGKTLEKITGAPLVLPVDDLVGF